jgi:hypothetical protein
MANDPRVTLRFEAKGERDAETAEFTPSLGAMMALDFGNAETTWRLDYRQSDRMRLRIDGSMRLVETRNLEISADARFLRDLVDHTTTIQGALEMEFDRDINVEITGASGPDGSYVGAGLTIEF